MELVTELSIGLAIIIQNINKEEQCLVSAM